jgi:two-component system, OmpR family, response regulator
MNRATDIARRRPKVLVVDDNDVCRAVVRESLEEGGFDVVELDNPVGMSSVVNHEKPDIVLMDVEMPAIDGDKAVQILLKHRLHDCKVLLYSGKPAVELERLVRTCGAAGFVSKSVTDAALASAVRSHLSA